MSLIDVGVGLLAVSMLIDLAMAIRDHVRGRRFRLFYSPADSRLASVVGLFLVVAIVVVAVFRWCFDLPNAYLYTALLIGVLIESWMSVFYRLRALLVKPEAVD